MNDVSVKKLELERLRINAMAFLSEDYHKNKNGCSLYIMSSCSTKRLIFLWASAVVQAAKCNYAEELAIKLLSHLFFKCGFILIFFPLQRGIFPHLSYVCMFYYNTKWLLILFIKKKRKSFKKSRKLNPPLFDFTELIVETVILTARINGWTVPYCVSG